MKKYLLILLSFVVLSACDSSDDPEVIADKPVVNSVAFSCAGAGTNFSRVVDANVTIPAVGSVKRLSLFTKSGQEVYYIDNPETGVHKLYNHLGDCGSVSPGSYYFVFTRTDGSKVVTDPYPKP